MGRTAEMVITNVYATGDYTGRLMVGDPPVAVDLLLDTGSSTLAIKPGHYDPDKDRAKKTTDAAQVVQYGTGGWEGPLFETRVTFPGEGSSGLTLETPVALAYPLPPRTNNFGQASGILGLAYKQLNDAFVYMDAQGKPIPTWPFDPKKLGRASRQIFVTPYFTQLEEQGVVANKFGFYTLRSIVRITDPKESFASAEADPWNSGLFIWGGGEDRTDLHTGEFQSVAVVHDQYYNTHLTSVRVGDGPSQPVGPPEMGKAASNSIVDSGTNSLALTPALYDAIHAGFSPEQRALLKKYAPPNPNQFTIAPTSALDLDAWPTLSFTFMGVGGGQVTLEVPPTSYWQTEAGFNTAGDSEATYHLNNTGEFGQSILGLPLMNNYFTIFDRSASRLGEIRVAPIKPPSS